MQIQNKYKHLHYLVCLGSGLRKATADITQDALPEQIQEQLRRLAGTADAAQGCNNRDGKHSRQG